MAGTLPTLQTLINRYQYLRGETDVTTVNAVNNSNINQAIWDALNEYNFIFNRTTTTGNIVPNSTGGTFSLPGDYNPTWQLPDVRILNGSPGSDYIFQPVPIEDINSYNTNSYIYWITTNNSTGVATFNTNQTSGTVTYTYHYIPAALVNTTDVCIIPDAEAIAMLALGKNWIGDERNQALAQQFTQWGSQKLAGLYQKSVAFGPLFSEGVITTSQPQMNGYGSDPGLNIHHP